MGLRPAGVLSDCNDLFGPFRKSFQDFFQCYLPIFGQILRKKAKIRVGYILNFVMCNNSVASLATKITQIISQSALSRQETLPISVSRTFDIITGACIPHRKPL